MAEPLRVLLRLSAAAALLLLCQCGSTPALQRVLTVTPDQPLRVSLVQVSGGQKLVLQNASAGSRERVYSDELSDRAVKVVDDAEMQTLVDLLATQGLFARAGAAPAADARELIAVQQGERRWVWSRRLGDTDLEAFNHARTSVIALYNATTAYHSYELSGEDLWQEQERIRRASEEARQKAERQGPPK